MRAGAFFATYPAAGGRLSPVSLISGVRLFSCAGVVISGLGLGLVVVNDAGGAVGVWPNENAANTRAKKVQLRYLIGVMLRGKVYKFRAVLMTKHRRRSGCDKKLYVHLQGRFHRSRGYFVLSCGRAIS
jgi:hypothetical protein